LGALGACIVLGVAWFALVTWVSGVWLRVGEACVIGLTAAGVSIVVWIGSRRRVTPPSSNNATTDGQTSLSELLGGIARCSEQIESFDASGLFNTVLKEELGSIGREMEIAAIKQSLDVTPRGHTTKPLLASMQGTSKDLCRFVHHLDNNDFFTSPHSRDFFERVFSRVTKDKKILEVRRLLVSYGQESSQHELTRRLIAFHKNVDGYDWRMIDWNVFDALAREEGYLDEHLDFGIYGDHYLYLSNQRPSDRRQVASGTFVAAQAEIKRYTDFFDFVWERLPVPNPETCEGSCATPEALFSGFSNDFGVDDIASATVELVRDLG
jgi:hypothetical protein